MIGYCVLKFNKVRERTSTIIRNTVEKINNIVPVLGLVTMVIGISNIIANNVKLQVNLNDMLNNSDLYNVIIIALIFQMGIISRNIAQKSEFSHLSLLKHIETLTNSLNEEIEANKKNTEELKKYTDNKIAGLMSKNYYVESTNYYTNLSEIFEDERRQQNLNPINIPQGGENAEVY